MFETEPETVPSTRFTTLVSAKVLFAEIVVEQGLEAVLQEIVPEPMVVAPIRRSATTDVPPETAIQIRSIV
jgi:hypothetical protein